MAEAILKGVIDSKILPAGDVFVTDALPDRRDYLRREFPAIRVVDTNTELVDAADVVIFAVKPQNMPLAMDEIALHCTPSQLFISICAGITTAIIEDGLRTVTNPKPRVVRVMPNTPALIGMGVAGVCPGSRAGEEDLAVARLLFEAVGEVVIVEESLMDLVTAVSGSGPAYVFHMIESLIEAGTSLGFTPEQARAFVLQMVRGSAELAHRSPKTPAELRRAVTSPGGTTAAGIAILEQRNVREAFAACVAAAENRGKELAEMNKAK